MASTRRLMRSYSSGPRQGEAKDQRAGGVSPLVNFGSAQTLSAVTRGLTPPARRVPFPLPFADWPPRQLEHLQRPHYPAHVVGIQPPGRDRINRRQPGMHRIHPAPLRLGCQAPAERRVQRRAVEQAV